MNEPLSRVTAQPRSRGIFCNRTLNLRAVKAVGYDMDYTLIHYKVEEWERRAFETSRDRLVAEGLPLADAVFDPNDVIRGLILDRELGNVVKTNRFGYVKAASHGTQALDFDTLRKVYARTIVDLGDSRWVFLNTLFSLSEASLYLQLVDRQDTAAGGAPVDYRALYDRVRRSIDLSHMEGALKAEIMADPDRFVELDPELPLTLLDQRHSGKKVALITNSEWGYTHAMMSYAVDRYLPEGKTWRDLFDLVIVGARKPDFFSGRQPTFEVIDTEAGTLHPVISGFKTGGAYFGGYAELVEQLFGVDGGDILYVGDHVYTDVKASKDIRRWRTALVLRELELEVEAVDAAHESQVQLGVLMQQKTAMENDLSAIRLAVQRKKGGYGPAGSTSVRELESEFSRTRQRAVELDERIAPLAKAAFEVLNPRWGLLMRAGNDKSHMARHVERHADIYTSRVSNFLHATPFVYLRSPRGALPHDP